jgi:hypothetical protein
MPELELLLLHQAGGSYQQQQQQWEQRKQQQLRKEVLAAAKSGKAVPWRTWLAVAKDDSVNQGLWPSRHLHGQQYRETCKAANSCIMLHTPVAGSSATAAVDGGNAGPDVSLPATSDGSSSNLLGGSSGKLLLLRYLWAYSTLEEMRNSLGPSEAAAKKCLRLCEQQQQEQQQKAGLGGLPPPATPEAGAVLHHGAVGGSAAWSCELLANPRSSPISVEAVQQKLSSMGLARVLQLAGKAIEVGQYKEAVAQLRSFCNNNAGERHDRN